MARLLRWCAVAAGVAVLVSLPPIVARLPARDSAVSAADLLAGIRASGQAGYSGYAEAVGGLRLPLTDEFAGLVDLFGDRTRLRVWWRGETDWRVDAIDPTGETDLHRDATGTWTWHYESNSATRAGETGVRLPRAADLDPAALGRRLLSEAAPAQVSRLPARRVAGRSVPGLRLRPADPQTTITHVDIWADEGTGVPLRVEVHGAGATRPVVQAAYLDFDPTAPDPGTTAWRPPPGDGISVQQAVDIAAAVDRFAPFLPPAELAGYRLRQRVDGLGAVGTYGSGVTVLTAVPLPGRVSRPLVRQLARTPGLRSTTAGFVLTIGPLSLMFADRVPGGRSWLLTGTVTEQTLERAAAELTARPPTILIGER